jgi:hypothetical protein
MKKLVISIALIFAGVVAWRIGGRLSPDALGMALGVLFGVLAGVPTAVMVLAASRRREDVRDETSLNRGGYVSPHAGGSASFSPQPPVIILTGNGTPSLTQQGYDDYGQTARYALPAPRTTEPERAFKVVGEREEWIDEW